MLRAGAKWILTLIAIHSFSAHAELIRVRLAQSKRPLQLTGLGLDVAAREDAALTVGFPTLEKAQVKLVQGKRGIPVWEIKYSKSGSTERVIGPTLKVRGELLRLGLEPVPHRLELHAADDNRVDVVSVMDLDTYLAGVLPSEMPVGWPLEALKAQVIASRTYALQLIRERRLRHYHLESTVFDQVYKTVSQLGLNDGAREKINRALVETNGEVLVDQSGNLIKAFYHADCGGHTELASRVWGEPGSDFGSVKDPFCPQSPLANWHYEIDRLVLAKLLTEYFALPGESVLQSLAIVSRTPSGRVAQLDVLFDGQAARRITAHEFRRVLGFEHVKSTQFSIQWQSRILTLEGKGHGHGVGMCQYGAKAMAKNGRNYRSILKHYYPGTKITHEPAVTAKANIESGKLVL